jgi:hypothetical protein
VCACACVILIHILGPGNLNDERAVNRPAFRILSPENVAPTFIFIYNNFYQNVI